MKLKDLIEAKTQIVSFSDLQSFGTLSAEFWIDFKDYIKQHKDLGQEAAIKLVVSKVKKIGEENYNSLKAASDKNRFAVPDFDVASNISKLTKAKGQDSRIVVLLDLVHSKSKVRKAKLEANLKKLQQQIEQLED